uniref:Uncharacterized protein n=1 Tax=Rhizophora mucronata TaxID=61149 RepID=A0A2P2PCF3_RHIMU
MVLCCGFGLKEAEVVVVKARDNNLGKGCSYRDRLLHK